MTRRPTTASDTLQSIARLRSGAVIFRQTIIRNVPTGLARNAAMAQLDAALDSAIDGVRGKEPADGG